MCGSALRELAAHEPSHFPGMCQCVNRVHVGERGGSERSRSAGAWVQGSGRAEGERGGNSEIAGRIEQGGRQTDGYVVGQTDRQETKCVYAFVVLNGSSLTSELNEHTRC